VAISEGQLVPAADTLRFDYYIKDHLGNVRVVFDENGDILQQSDYYSFGLSIARDNPVQSENIRENLLRKELNLLENILSLKSLHNQSRFLTESAIMIIMDN